MGMNWINEDGIILTEEQFEVACNNCMGHCSEGCVSVPCKGDKLNCPNFGMVDTSEYDAAVRNRVIDELTKALIVNFTDWQMSNASVGNEEKYEVISKAIKGIEEIAEQMKESSNL